MKCALDKDCKSGDMVRDQLRTHMQNNHNMANDSTNKQLIDYILDTIETDFNEEEVTNRVIFLFHYDTIETYRQRA